MGYGKKVEDHYRPQYSALLVHYYHIRVCTLHSYSHSSLETLDIYIYTYIYVYTHTHRSHKDPSFGQIRKKGTEEIEKVEGRRILVLHKSFP